MRLIARKSSFAHLPRPRAYARGYDVEPGSSSRPLHQRRKSFINNTERLDAFFILALATILAGYATLGRTFAYIGVPPVFIGELTLLLGIATAFSRSRIFKLPNTVCVWALLGFMSFCALRTIPGVGRYGLDAMRDAMLWGYAMFAIVTMTVLIDRPNLFATLLNRYGKFVWLFIVFAPCWVVMNKLFGENKIPGTTVAWVDVKAGDQCVHLTGAFAYIGLLWTRRVPAFTFLFLPVTLALSLVNRGGLVSFALATAIILFLRPKTKFVYQVIASMFVGAFLMWALDVRIPFEGRNREISVDQVVLNIQSLLGFSKTEALDGTKEWRMNWWKDIINYTVHGNYFWTGKGFGVNLASDDGYVVDAEETLRSPHNGHMNILARTGVPGLMMWAFLHGAWAMMMISTYANATRRGEQKWAGVILFIFVYWLAAMCNASFDVFLEGPLGGVWMWSLWGCGVAACKIFRDDPRVLDENDSSSRSATLQRQPLIASKNG